MQTTLIDPADLSRLVHFFDILAAASRKGMDVMGFIWLAVITGVGGGTVRAIERSCGSTPSVWPWSPSPARSRLWVWERPRWWPSRWARSPGLSEA
jgi:hypothetical protein